jgi:hypothetical protein
VMEATLSSASLENCSLKQVRETHHTSVLEGSCFPFLFRLLSAFSSRVPTTGLCCCGCIGDFHSALDLSFAHVDYLLPPLVRLSSFTRSSRP